MPPPRTPHPPGIAWWDQGTLQSPAPQRAWWAVVFAAMLRVYVAITRQLKATEPRAAQTEAQGLGINLVSVQSRSMGSFELSRSTLPVEGGLVEYLVWKDPLQEQYKGDILFLAETLSSYLPPGSVEPHLKAGYRIIVTDVAVHRGGHTVQPTDPERLSGIVLEIVREVFRVSAFETLHMDSPLLSSTKRGSVRTRCNDRPLYVMGIGTMALVALVVPMHNLSWLFPRSPSSTTSLVNSSKRWMRRLLLRLGLAGRPASVESRLAHLPVVISGVVAVSPSFEEPDSWARLSLFDGRKQTLNRRLSQAIAENADSVRVPVLVQSGTKEAARSLALYNLLHRSPDASLVYVPGLSTADQQSSAILAKLALDSLDWLAEPEADVARLQEEGGQRSVRFAQPKVRMGRSVSLRGRLRSWDAGNQSSNVRSVSLPALAPVPDVPPGAGIRFVEQIEKPLAARAKPPPILLLSPDLVYPCQSQSPVSSSASSPALSPFSCASGWSDSTAVTTPPSSRSSSPHLFRFRWPSRGSGRDCVQLVQEVSYPPSVSEVPIPSSALEWQEAV